MFRQPVKKAIETRTVLIFSYDGEEREVEPHILGVSTAGNVVVCGWQRSGELPGWRNYLLPGVTELTRTAIRFSAPHEGYNPEDSTFARITCRIEPGPASNPVRAER